MSCLRLSVPLLALCLATTTAHARDLSGPPPALEAATHLLKVIAGTWCRVGSSDSQERATTVFHYERDYVDGSKCPARPAHRVKLARKGDLDYVTGHRVSCKPVKDSYPGRERKYRCEDAHTWWMSEITFELEGSSLTITNHVLD
jgi:hypothetical protein